VDREGASFPALKSLSETAGASASLPRALTAVGVLADTHPVNERQTRAGRSGDLVWKLATNRPNGELTRCDRVRMGLQMAVVVVIATIAFLGVLDFIVHMPG
jgi:hypothetical protein